MADFEAGGEICIPINASEQIEYCYEKGWTDGLPVVPATPDLLKDMLEAGGFRGDEVIADMPSRNVSVTAEKVAINAVMAGCKASYMPVVATAVKALADPGFGLHHVASALSGPTPVIIVNGPIIEEIGLNATDNLFGPGCRANSTIGRALRLVLGNCLRYKPGISDRATYGTPGKHSCCIAENASGNPWETWHVEQGLQPGDSTVTLIACSSMMQLWNYGYGGVEGLLNSVGDALSFIGSIAIFGQTPGAVIFGGDHTEWLKEGGWTKNQIREVVVENTKRSIAALKRAGRLEETEIKPGDEETWHYAMDEPSELMILTAGSETGPLTCVLPGFGSSKTAGRSATLKIERT